jgi:hypothetical protein
MTINEFNMWLSGYSEAAGITEKKAPTREQWKRIHEQLKSVHQGCGCNHWTWTNTPLFKAIPMGNVTDLPGVDISWDRNSLGTITASDIYPKFENVNM